MLAIVAQVRPRLSLAGEDAVGEGFDGRSLGGS